MFEKFILLFLTICYTTIAQSQAPTLAPTDVPSTSAPTVPDCEPNWSLNDKDCYYMNENKQMTRQACYDKCASFNGIYSNKDASMLCIQSGSQNSFISSLTSYTYWIGFIEQTQGLTKTWIWSTGEYCSSYYSAWDADEPSDVFGTDDCATSKRYSYGTYWDDESCNDIYVCGCQMPSNSATGTAKLVLGLLVIPAAIMISFF